jgi:hypothetical protein
MNYSNLTAAVDNIIELNKRLTAMTQHQYITPNKPANP